MGQVNLDDLSFDVVHCTDNDRDGDTQSSLTSIRMVTEFQISLKREERDSNGNGLGR